MFEVRVLEPDDLTAAADLLVARQADARAEVPALPALGERDVVAAALGEALPSGTGVSAWREDRLVGFAIGRANGSFALVPAAQHAVAADEGDPTRVYGGLYVALSERWIRQGAYVHDVESPALARVTEPWFDLGFGRRTCFGVRSTAIRPDDPVPSPEVAVREATRDDLETVARLAMQETDYRLNAPVYAQQARADLAEHVAQHLALMEAGATHLLARWHGEDVGLLTLERSSPAPCFSAERSPFIGATGVDATKRGGGFGRTLVAGALDWSRRHGFEWIGVSFNTTNLMSRPFWRGAGFVPSGWKLARRLPPPSGASGGPST